MQGNNRYWYLFFSILSYTISAMASITFVWGLHINNLELVQLSATCILFMAGAWFTLKETSAIRHINYADNKQEIIYKHKGFSRFCYIVLYIICTTFSIFTTANMAFEAINRNSDYETKNSDIYKNIQASSTTAQSSIDINNAYIKDLLDEKKKAYDKQMEQVNKWKTTRVKERQAEIDKANKIAKEYDKKIEKAKIDNKEYKKDIDKASSPTDITTNTTKSTIVNMFPNVNFILIALFVMLLLSIGVDLLGAFFTIQYSKESYFMSVADGNFTPPSDKKPIPTPEKNDKKSSTYKFKKGKISSAPSMQKNNVVPFSKNANAPVDAHSTDSNRTEIGRKSDGNRTGFQTEISNPILKKYIEVMYRTAKNNVCIWQKTIATEVGITSHQATKIIGYLKHLGIVEVSGNTKILISKEEALQKIKKGA